jgi:hypothetical protein
LNREECDDGEVQERRKLGTKRERAIEIDKVGMKYWSHIGFRLIGR